MRNAGARTIPNIAVTLDSFYYTSTYPKLAVNKRPVWIVNTGPGRVATSPPVQTEEVNPPGGGETAFVNTWALGALAPHASRIFIWHVTPVKAGVHTVHYTVAAGLDGKARARLAGGGLATGSLIASVAPAPPRTHVNPETGEIEPGPHPAFDDRNSPLRIVISVVDIGACTDVRDRCMHRPAEARMRASVLG